MKLLLRRAAAVLLGVVLLGGLGLYLSARPYVQRELYSLVPAPTAPAAPRFAGAPSAERLHAHVEVLAADALGGRDNGTRGGERARAYIEATLKDLGLEPFWPSGFVQPLVPGSGANVAAVFAAGAPADAPYVLVGAHYDHLGTDAEGAIYNGADDNASGVAVMLETARVLAARRPSLARRVLFVAFDAEEQPDFLTETMGSASFVRSLPVPLERIHAALIMDLVGGDLLPFAPDTVFVMGMEQSPELSAVVRAAGLPEGLRVQPLSVAMIEAVPFAPWKQRALSDYQPFRALERPYVFLSCGRTPRYHTPEDDTETLRYPKMARITELLLELVAGIAELPAAPQFVALAVDARQDAMVLDELLAGMLGARGVDAGEVMTPRLHKGLELVRTLRARVDAGQELSAWEYRSLQLVSLRAQCVLYRPGWPMCEKI